MKFRYVGNKCTPRESTKEYTEKKLSKLNRFFSGDCTADVVYTLEKGDRFKVEVTVIYEGIIFRAQSVTDDFMHSIDEVVDLLVRQIRKHKTKLQKRGTFYLTSLHLKAPNDLPRKNCKSRRWSLLRHG